VEEEQETELKASALLAALRLTSAAAIPAPSLPPVATGAVRSGRPALRVLLIDHRDSFVHTLGDYFRQLGCSVTTRRFDRVLPQLHQAAPELVVLSPGPSRPDDFRMRATLRALEHARTPVFGVCLGLQGIVEYCGGRLHQLDTPMHGKATDIQCGGDAKSLFAGLPRELRVGRYHSLYAPVSELPAQLVSLAVSEADGACMALEHRSLPWVAVQFHPESILSAEASRGLALISNVVESARRHQLQTL